MREVGYLVRWSRAVSIGIALFVGGCLDSSGLGVLTRDAGIDRSADGHADANAGKGGTSSGDAAAKDGAFALGGTSGAGGFPVPSDASGTGGAPSASGVGGTGDVPRSGGILGAGGVFSAGGATGIVGSGGARTMPIGGGGGANGGAPSSSGKGGGGVPAAGGTAGGVPDAATDGNNPDARGDSRGIACGSRTCGANEVCCSPSCGLCTPIGSACLDVVCAVDGGITSDAGGCRSMPSSDARYCGGTGQPHAYLCTLASMAAPCVIARSGVLTGLYCCP